MRRSTGYWTRPPTVATTHVPACSGPVMMRTHQSAPLSVQFVEGSLPNQIRKCFEAHITARNYPYVVAQLTLFINQSVRSVGKAWITYSSNSGKNTHRASLPQTSVPRVYFHLLVSKASRSGPLRASFKITSVAFSFSYSVPNCFSSFFLKSLLKRAPDHLELGTTLLACYKAVGKVQFCLHSGIFRLCY